ncbi:MAG: transposase [Acidimicrobiales bacterium]|jgi:IS30 family transposase
MKRKAVRFTDAERNEIWDRIEAGESVASIATHFHRYPSAIRQMQLATGGVRPAVRNRSRRALSLAEREEISRGVCSGESMRSIAKRIGRAPSSVSRELARNGGRRHYRAVAADARALRRVRRPKPPKLACCRELWRVVEEKLELRWSPQQIAKWLPGHYPDDVEMRVSHETIYMSLFVQGRGALRKELPRRCAPGARSAVRRPRCRPARASSPTW